jgi:hypothetical protein
MNRFRNFSINSLRTVFHSRRFIQLGCFGVLTYFNRNQVLALAQDQNQNQNQITTFEQKNWYPTPDIKYFVIETVINEKLDKFNMTKQSREKFYTIFKHCKQFMIDNSNKYVYSVVENKLVVMQKIDDTKIEPNSDINYDTAKFYGNVFKTVQIIDINDPNILYNQVETIQTLSVKPMEEYNVVYKFDNKIVYKVNELVFSPYLNIEDSNIRCYNSIIGALGNSHIIPSWFTGKWTIYMYDGNISEICSIVNGVKHGECIEYDYYSKGFSNRFQYKNGRKV